MPLPANPLRDPFRAADPLWTCPACRGLNIYAALCWACGAARPLPVSPR